MSGFPQPFDLYIPYFLLLKVMAAARHYFGMPRAIGKGKKALSQGQRGQGRKGLNSTNDRNEGTQ
jgi:hypothetical protein